MNKHTIIIVVIAILVIGGIAARRHSPEQTPPPVVTNTAQGVPSTTPPTTSPPATPPTAPTPTAAVSISTTSATKSFTVKGDNFAFDPKTMSVKKGDTVKITFVNVEGFHDLRVDGYNVATAKLAAGKSETITFVANKAGTFEYYCTVGSHRAMGMSGTLTVTE